MPDSDFHAHLRRTEAWTTARVLETLERYFPEVDAPEPVSATPSAHRDRSLFPGRRHLGFSFRSFAGLADETPDAIALLDFDEIAHALMALDWVPQTLERRLQTLRGLRTDEKSGCAWLMGRDEPPPLARSFGDRLRLGALLPVFAGFDAYDRGCLRTLEAGGDSRRIVRAVTALYRSGLVRGMKIGYMVPRLILLREVAHAAGDPALATEVALGSAEIALQYREWAQDAAGVARCHQVALSWLAAACDLGPTARRRVGESVSLLLRSAHAGGCSAAAMRPFPVALVAEADAASA